MNGNNAGILKLGGITAAASIVCLAIAFAASNNEVKKPLEYDTSYAKAPTPTKGNENRKLEGLPTATFGAGCFWGVEDQFRKVKGVLATWTGYEGGTVERPSYEDVCSHTTGHAEVVQLKYDPEQISYSKLVDIFFRIHDPTTLNRQGPDIGDNYRSVIFYHNQQQKQEAESMKQKLDESGRFKNPIVTQICPTSVFYPAENYHQQYHDKYGGGCSLP